MILIRKYILLTFFMGFPMMFSMALEISLDSTNLEVWNPLTFSKISRHTEFATVQEDGYSAAIEVESVSLKSVSLRSGTMKFLLRFILQL
ncbi:hypothetical protein [Oceanispirochaeta sp.]|uniref:hypothetical protein n=1 Tax=Oceanispirochaeta sp. TaxID=2035350 RepID=UPI00262A2332|nr:hypothetical protein [Oceanispirochaeta sp.]MDA3957132.1 hypothetical protein [Oceanispirochaeta sp.]